MNVVNRSDAELIAATQTGDKQAFGQLIERHLPATRQLALQFVADSDLAWELAQEATLQAYLALSTLRDPERFRYWLNGITRNVCRNYLRRRKNHLPTVATWFSSSDEDGESLSKLEPDPHDLVEARELHRLVQVAIDALSPKNRATLLLFYYEQLSLEEIATQLGASVTAIKNRLHQARKQMQTQLAPEYKPSTQPIPSLHVATNRRSTMIKISSLHAIPNEASQSAIVYLLDSANHRILRIWIGPYEGDQIYQAIHGFTSQRPLTYQFFGKILEKLGNPVQEVRIESLKDNTFYATVKLRYGQESHEVDARPSDAIALALHMNRPIFVSKELMAQVGQDLPQPFDEPTWLKAETQTLATGGNMPQKLQEKLLAEPSLFAPDAQQAIQQAQQIALSYQHNYVGTEHLLLGLVSDKTGEIAQLLRDFDLAFEQISVTLERLVGRGATIPTTEPRMAPRVATVLYFASTEAESSGQAQLNNRHLLTALLREGQGMAIKIMRDLGVEPSVILQKLKEAA